MAWCQAKTGNELAPSQQAALRQALSSRALILTGGRRQDHAGKRHPANPPGKEGPVPALRSHGRAAKRLAETAGVAAKTIHRLLEVNLASAGFTRNEGRPLECDLLVVDENSMVDVLLMNSLLGAHGGDYLAGTPCGSIRARAGGISLPSAMFWGIGEVLSKMFSGV